VLFSLDLQHGIPLGDRAAWDHARALEIAVRAIEMGLRRLLVLDLAKVGLGAGPGTEDLCSHLAQMFPHLDLVAGGGIGGLEDLHRLGACGVRTVLLASVLHDGRITQSDLEHLRKNEKI